MRDLYFLPCAKHYILKINKMIRVGEPAKYIVTIVVVVGTIALWVDGSSFRTEQSCGPPVRVEDGFSWCTGYDLNNTCSFGCLSGFNMLPNEATHICNCTDNVSCHWYGPTVKCQKPSCHTPLFNLGSIVITNVNSSHVTTSVEISSNVSEFTSWGLIIFFSSKLLENIFVHSTNIGRVIFCDGKRYALLSSWCKDFNSTLSNIFDIEIDFHGISESDHDDICNVNIGFLNSSFSHCCYNDLVRNYVKLSTTPTTMCYRTSTFQPTTTPDATTLPQSSAPGTTQTSQPKSTLDTTLPLSTEPGTTPRFQPDTTISTPILQSTSPTISTCTVVPNANGKGYKKKSMKFLKRQNVYRGVGRITIPPSGERYVDWVVWVTFETIVNIQNSFSVKHQKFCDGLEYYFSPKKSKSKKSIKFGFIFKSEDSDITATVRICTDPSDLPILCGINGVFEMQNDQEVWSCDRGFKSGSLPHQSKETIPTFKPYSGKLIFNPNELLHKSILFYEAQESGYLSPNNRVPWRGNSGLKDGCVTLDGSKHDLTGGWYDGANSMKFNLPMASASTVLAWGGLEFVRAYTMSEENDNLLNQLSFVADYLIKCHTKKFEFWGQVGSTEAEFATWTRPEENTNTRTAFKINESQPGSDLAGEASAALSAIALIFKNIDPDYFDELKQHALELYEFADKKRGSSHDAIPDSAMYYKSWDGFGDELVWSCLWKWKLTKSSSVLEDCKNKYIEFAFDKTIAYEFSWSNKIPGAQVLLYESTGNIKYMDDAKLYVKGFLKNSKTPSGLYFYNSDAPNKFAANFATICLMIAKQREIEREEHINLALSQINVLVGDSSRSYVVGYGSNSPTQPHHASSSCPKWSRLAYKKCSWRDYFLNKPNPHILYGALVGGPVNLEGDYYDLRADYRSNGVSCDNNAGFQTAIAGLYYFVDGLSGEKSE